MLNATEFIYDGVISSKYGLKIASFNGDALQETSYAVPNLSFVRSAKSFIFHFLDKSYESPPTFEFSIISEETINDNVLREILVWLDSRNDFKELIFMQPGFDKLTYRCIFTVTSLIYHSGKCIGLNLNATFDSNYVLGEPLEINTFGDGTIQYIDMYLDSDNIENYIYPSVEFDSSDGKITIVNETDNPLREFSFSGLVPNTKYSVDNDLKIISGEGRNLLAKFSKNWMRVLRGKNKLKIKINGVVTITCPRYIKITF